MSKPSANSTANGRVVENACPVLRGRIADADGHPISDVQVVLYGGVATRLRGQETRTDEKGEFRFAPLKTGALRFPENGGSHWYTGVRFKHPEYVPADGSSWRDIDVPNITGHEEVLDLTMTPGGKVSGTVEDDKGGKVSELALRIYTDPDNVPDAAYFLVYATTDRHGRFESEALFPGRYTIDINSAIYQGQHRYPRIGRVMVREGETAEVRLNTPADNTGAVAQPVDLTFIIAEHVILHEGEIIEWDDVERLILEHPNPSLVHPAFRFTHGAIPTRQEEIRPKNLGLAQAHRAAWPLMGISLAPSIGTLR